MPSKPGRDDRVACSLKLPFLDLGKSRKENPQKLTQLSSRSHPRDLVGKRTTQKDTITDITIDSQVNSNFPYRWSPASLTFNKPNVSVSWESPIDCHAGHMVAWMPEPLEIGFGFTHTLEGCRIAGLHIDAVDVPRIVVHRIPQPVVSVLHTSLLNVLR